MDIYDGNKYDVTNFEANVFMQINSCGFQNSSPDHIVIRNSGRKDYHILLINSGVCEVFYDEKLYTLTDGNIVIYQPNKKQKYTFKTESMSFWCHFTGTAIPEILSAYDLTYGIHLLSPNEIIFEKFLSLIRRFNQEDTKTLANASFLELLFHIGNSIKSAKSEELPDSIVAILNYMNMNYNKQITLDILAEKSGYSKSRFSHMFVDITGTSPIKYLNDIRLRTSCEMLSATNLQINEISDACGFKDPLYFCRIFKKKYHISPSKYRLSSINQ